MLFSTTFLVFASVAVAAPPQPPQPTQPKVSFLFQTNFTIPRSAVVEFGAVPYGSKRDYLGITGGTFAGPKLKGKQVASQSKDLALTEKLSNTGKVLTGADWGLWDLRGRFAPDAVFAFETHDGAKIFVTEKGRVPNMQMLFETADKRYDWLNDAVAYAVGGPRAQDNTTIELDVWQLGA